ncbi:MAG: 5-deoxy-glucuronate isomerase, partial [Bryobacteraceae bacterium]
MSTTLTSATEPAVASGIKVLPAVLVRTADEGVTFRQRFTPKTANLQFLNCGEYSLPPQSESQSYCMPRHESLLFQWEGSSVVTVNGAAYCLATYDTLYIPRGAEFTLANGAVEPARVIQTSAPADKAHPIHHSVWKQISRDESRIRHLKGKDVFMMFDVTEPGEKLVAGYTFFQPRQRSWPPHNHTDQEEAYIFINGHGAMEVYEEPETLSFVHSVNRGDLVTIPFLNYHPVFSQEDPLEFIWCIAGERYWVGDKNKDFMAG